MSNNRPEDSSDRVASGHEQPRIQWDLTVAGLLNIGLRNLRLLFLTPMVFAVAGLLYSVLGPTQHVATSSFAPQGASASSSAARLAGLAARFGVPTGSLGEAGESIYFYAKLIKSTKLLRDIATTYYQFEAGDPPTVLEGTYLDLQDIEGETERGEILAAIWQLEGNVTVEADAESGIVTVRTRSDWPALAELMNRRILDLLTEFNLESRQSQAAAERRFLQTRMSEAKSELTAAESALEQFYESNKNFSGSPQLRFQEGRLMRQLELRQQVFSSLAQSYEESRIEEVRNTPVITVVDPPEGSAEPRGRGPVVMVLIGGVLGLILAGFLIFVREYVRAERTLHPDLYQSLGARLRALSLNPLRRNHSSR